MDLEFAKSKEELFVGLEGSFGSKHVSPRTLTARNLGNMVCVEGIVTKCECTPRREGDETCVLAYTLLLMCCKLYHFFL